MAQNICHGVHCPPRSAGKMFDMCKPRLGVIYHTMLSEDLRVPIIDDVRYFWKGPVALAEDLPFEDSSIDIIFGYDVYEHVEDLDKALAEADRVLKVDGILYISVPNPNSLGAKLKGRYPEFKGLPLSERRNQWFGWQDDTHLNIFPISEWRSKISKHNFDIIKDGSDYWWDSPYISWLPIFPQDIVCKVLQRIFTRITYFTSWHYGENYIGIYQKKN